MPTLNYNVFISYSRANQDQKKRLLIHLDALTFDGTIGKPWHDRLIGAGDIWRDELDNAMNEAEVALLLVSADFIASPFCQDVEVPKILERHKNDGVLIVPIIVGHCGWKHIPWLSQFQVLPEDGKPVMSQVPRDKAWTQVIEGLRWQLEKKPPVKKPGSVEVHHRSEDKQPEFSLAKLLQAMPGESGDLFGREEALGWLDEAYANSNVSVLALVGFGGVGKSALVRHWIETRFLESDKELPRFLGVSFYSQGTREQAAGSSDQFLIRSLELFGKDTVTQKSAWDRGRLLGELIAEKPTVFVLDGLEPLQYGPGPHNLEGQLKDPGVHALLAHLAESPGKLLSIVSSRVPLTDADLQGTSFVQRSIEILSPEAARELMLARGVRGNHREITKAVDYLGRHPLALLMAAEYLHTFAEGDVNRLHEIPLLSENTREGRHAKSVMAAYGKSLRVDGDPLDVELLGILGLFDRPIRWSWLKALSGPPSIKNVTDQLVKATERELWQSISRLRQWGMLADPGSVEAPQLDAHPLIREYFGAKLKNQNKEEWCAAHSRLFDYLASITRQFPDTIEEMEPLYQAIAHGCEAGRYQEALNSVYLRRVQRGNEYFSLNNLGAFGADLTALSGFFDVPWNRPVSALSEADKGLVLSIAGFILRASGRLKESTQPMRAGLEIHISQRQWKHAAGSANNLSETYLTLGDLSQAQSCARQGLNYADESGDSIQSMLIMTTLANILHDAGRLLDSEKVFRNAEKKQNGLGSRLQILYSVQGFQYCDLLLDQGNYQEVQIRAEQTLTLATTQGWLLDIALDCLSLGRSYLRQPQRELTSNLADATEYLERAVDGLRQAGTLYQLPRGLLARAELFRVTGQFDRAQGDLEEAIQVATRDSMGLYQADCHLEYARLYLTISEKENKAISKQQKKEKGREHWQTAKEMIDRMGYHRRDKDVQEIEKVLN